MYMRQRMDYSNSKKKINIFVMHCDLKRTKMNMERSAQQVFFLFIDPAFHTHS